MSTESNSTGSTISLLASTDGLSWEVNKTNIIAASLFLLLLQKFISENQSEK